MMAVQHVQHPHAGFGGERQGHQGLSLGDEGRNHFLPEGHVAQQLALIGVAQPLGTGQLADLADVVHQATDQHQVAIHTRVERADPVSNLHHAGDMLQQATRIGMMRRNPSRGAAEPLDDFGIEQHGLTQRPQREEADGPDQVESPLQ